MSTIGTTLAEKLANLLLRLVMTSAERLRRVVRLFSYPELFGTHAIALLTGGQVVLVKLRYVPGWRLPGGSIEAGESAEEAALRELREEIGLIEYADIVLVRESPEHNLFRRGAESVFLVTGATYRQRWTLEVEAVGAFDLTDLPGDLSPWTKRALQDAQPLIGAKLEQGRCG